MLNSDLSILNKVYGFIDKSELGHAIDTIRPFLASHPYLVYDNEVDAIYEDYRRMADYMYKGYSDPERAGVYRALLRRMYIFTSDLYMAYRCRHDRLFVEASQRSAQHYFSNEDIKAEVDNFVSDVAVIGLEPEQTRQSKEAEIYRRHQDFMSLLFDSILVSSHWKHADAEFYNEMLLSPVIEPADAALIVSAITLSCINVFDIAKFAVLVNVYRKSRTETVRQRALVGWVLAMDGDNFMSGERQELIDAAKLTEDDAREIADLQKQIVFCMNAEKDNETIQRDIMPTLIRNNNLNITRDGIVEKEDDPMEDILAPDAADKRMEEMEGSLQNMINMQKAGSDVYFGGFSHMKRFPFYYTLSNWFTPFYIKHPDLRSALGKLDNSKVIETLLSQGPFCESDKYSFALAMSTVIDRMPANVREMLGSADNLMIPGGTGTVEQGSAPYIRRMYLQDLYRFFRLHPQRDCMSDPFLATGNRYVVAASPLFDATPLRMFSADLCSFFHKRHDGNALRLLLERYDNPTDATSMRLWALYESVYAANTQEAVRRYRMLADLEPENVAAISGLARAYLADGNYESAINLYGQLVSTDSVSKSILLNYSVALIKSFRYDDAVKVLYRLDYENPDDVNVIRLLAWALMGQNNLAQASKEYDRLLSHPRSDGNDNLNAGYCCWFKGDISAAVSYFNEYMERGDKLPLEDEIDNDIDIIRSHGISDIDIILMKDILFRIG